jgi:hypothetical protein
VRPRASQRSANDMVPAIWPRSAARIASKKGTSRGAGFAPGCQGSRVVPHGESKWQEEAGRPGRESSTPCPPGV